MNIVPCLDVKGRLISEFLSENFHFSVVKFSVYLNRRVFVMRKFGNVPLIGTIGVALLYV